MPYTCNDCGREFSLPASITQKYPNWTPKQCMDCRPAAGGQKAGSTAPAPKRPRSVTSTQDLSTAEVLERFSEGPTTGIFTDGSSRPNPGPGGWGAVFVRDGEIVEQRHGKDEWTTNNRMELTAMIAGLDMAPASGAMVVYSDSLLVVNTLTKWAKGWEARGWKRKEGEIANLDLVQRAFELVGQKPNVHLEWIRAHDGSRWNEYADALSTAHLRAEA